MSQQNDAAKVAAEEKKAADAEAKKKADADKKAKADAEAKEKAAKPKQVRVICDGTLGPKLLKKGDVTDDEEYVALLDSERGRTLVEEVK